MEQYIEKKIGIFKGFSDYGLEFCADIIIEDYEPTIGEFILIKHDDEKYILGKITKFSPIGMFSVFKDEEDINRSKLKYSIRLKLLGTLKNGSELFFTSSVRQIPLMNSDVYKPTNMLIEYICKKLSTTNENEAASIGHYCLGDIQYFGELREKVRVFFDINNLIAKRSFVFAKSGYGKSNLVKLLISKLYQNEEQTGMIIFDRDGEYAFSEKEISQDKKGYGLLNVDYLSKKLAVYTDRNQDENYTKWIYGQTKIDLTKLKASTVVNMCFCDDNQGTNHLNYMRGCSSENWQKLIELIEKSNYKTDIKEVAQILGEDTNISDPMVQNNMTGIISALTPIINLLHSKESKLLDDILEHLDNKNIVVIDTSVLSSKTAQILTNIILDKILKHNQDSFTSGKGKMVPTIAVIEEAQNFLSKENLNDSSPVVQWIKEGKKYKLGSLLVIEQPSAIVPDLLSQGDNFFTFHLVSENDLKTLQNQNAHFTDDILMSLLNEKIRGNAYFWSAPNQPFVLSAKIDDFDSYVEGLKAEGKTRIINPNITNQLIPSLKLKSKRESLKKLLLDFISQIESNNNEESLYHNLKYDKQKFKIIRTWRMSFELVKYIFEQGKSEEYDLIFPIKIHSDGKKYYELKLIRELLKELNLFISEKKYEDKEYFVVKRNCL